MKEKKKRNQALIAKRALGWSYGKLEGAEKKKSKIGFEKPGTKMQQIKQRVFAQGPNTALTTIITRYKEELKVEELLELEKGV